MSRASRSIANSAVTISIVGDARMASWKALPTRKSAPSVAPAAISGGTLPLTVYPWFACRISEDGAGWQFEKLTGSQRTKGMFYTLSATRLAYLGAGYVNGDKPRIYGQDAKENQVAIVERRAKNRLVFLFPAPQYESKLDILVMER